MKAFLASAEYIDSDHPLVTEFAQKAIGDATQEIDKAVRIYYAVRDGFKYNPYHLDLRPEAMKASALLQRDYGYCGEKSCLLAAAARAVGIPSRVGFANVRNHIATERLEAILATDLLVFHGYTELFLDGKWVKATPAFNRELCVLLNVAPLEFNGKKDSIFQEYDRAGNKYMDYVHFYGEFTDIPYELFLSELKKYYPHLFVNPTGMERNGIILKYEKSRTS